jgi:hypothetical protein
MTDDQRARLPGHRCQHGVLRAHGQFEMYAGPTYHCTCCRSHFGSLKVQYWPKDRPITCPGCTEGEVELVAFCRECRISANSTVGHEAWCSKTGRVV